MENQEIILDIPAEHERNIFGGLDCHVKKIEKTLHVGVITRDGENIGKPGTCRRGKARVL